MTGSAMVGVGFFGLDAMGKAIDKAKEYQKQLSLLKATGASPAEVAKDVATSWATSSQVITTSAADNVKAIRELRSVLGAGNTDAVASVLPNLQRVSAIVGGYGKDPEGVAQDIARITEMRSVGRAITAGDINHNAELVSHTVAAMGANVTPSDILAVMKQAKMSGGNLSDDFLYKQLPFLIQEFKTNGGGGSGAVGTALMTLGQAVEGGVLKKSSIPLWEQMGLVDPKDVVKNATGQLQLKPGAMAGHSLFETNPNAWATQFLAPAIEKYRSTHKDADGKELSVQDVIYALYGNRNAQNQIFQYLQKAENINRDAATIARLDKTSSAAIYAQQLKDNPDLAMQALQAQLTNAETRLGIQVLPDLIKATDWAANELAHLSDFMGKHRTAVKLLAEGFVGLSGALMFSGTLVTLNAGFKLLRIAMTAMPAKNMANAIGNINTTAASAAGGLNKFGKAMQWVGGLALAWEIGHKIGAEMNRDINRAATAANDGKKSTWGGTVYDLLHPVNPATGRRELSWTKWMTESKAEFNANNALEGNPLGGLPKFNAVAPSKPAPSTINSTLYLQPGATTILAKGVTQWQSDQLNRPQSGTSGPDTSYPGLSIGYTSGQ
ncbi:hypothetical protein [Dyella sp.]|uniref:hypothetical protein n=1 Tax=Dyella sp. TaxID=1869338 RepID=UPI002D7F7717|nr:hypothetical protein [Dyella sp.]